MASLQQELATAFAKAYADFARFTQPLVDPTRVDFEIVFSDDFRVPRAVEPRDPAHLAELPRVLHKRFYDSIWDVTDAAFDKWSSRLQQSPQELLKPTEEYTAAVTKLLDAAVGHLKQHARSSQLLRAP
uniref:Uncharacterized protein n=1 Tax=Neobodo designis TaxID=312471 RepID=A0A7S1QB25_NEODS